MERYGDRKLSAAELMVADDHLAICESCRQRAIDPQRLQTSASFLRRNYATQSKLELTHLSYEQFEAYVDGDLEAADREIVDSHAEICSVCREELQDLQEFRSKMPESLPRQGQASVDLLPDSNREQASEYNQISCESGDLSRSQVPKPRSGEQDSAELNGEREARFWRVLGKPRSHPIYWSVAAGMAVLVGAIALQVPAYYQHSRSPIANQTPTPSAATNVQTPPDQIDASDLVLLGKQELETPSALAGLIGKPGTLLGQSTHQNAFELLSPVGTFVKDQRPTLRWQELTGASNYEVSIYDSSLNQVAESGMISGTSWTPNISLQREQVYLWQVTATKNGEQVVVPTPPAPEAKFEIIGDSQANEIDQLKSSQPDAHFLLARVYAAKGLLDEAEREFQLVPVSDGNYNATQKFISDLRHLRHRD